MHQRAQHMRGGCGRRSEIASERRAAARADRPLCMAGGTMRAWPRGRRMQSELAMAKLRAGCCTPALRKHEHRKRLQAARVLCVSMCLWVGPCTGMRRVPSLCVQSCGCESARMFAGKQSHDASMLCAPPQFCGVFRQASHVRDLCRMSDLCRMAAWHSCAIVLGV